MRAPSPSPIIRSGASLMSFAHKICDERAHDADNMQRMMNITPLKRVGEPHEIAAAVAYLLGPNASYVTGATLDVNGGI